MMQEPSADHATSSFLQTGLHALARGLVLIGTPTTVRSLSFAIREERNDRSMRPHALPIGCFLTEKPNGQDFIAGLPVLGTFSHIATHHRIEPITFAIISLPATQDQTLTSLRTTLRVLNIPAREVSPITDVLKSAMAARSQTQSFTPPRQINFTDLIGRTPYGIDRREVSQILTSKRILITGAGGSIGSELCRIACTFDPEEIILVERGENALFEIDRQIARLFPHIKRRACLHDCVDAQRTHTLFTDARPHAIFHAAAHKHVPLMEDHPTAAITNNVLGTKSVADAAIACNAERFVMISSDKAVNPSSVMGATKRLAEMYIQHLASMASQGQHATQMSMVRFGNVLGSACSVLPIWSNQLAEGGPITVTDERMTRYFMTIHEAATLVIQSSALPQTNDASHIYVLDMGAPIRIIDLAERFARLCDVEPYRDGQAPPPLPNAIMIKLTGARPGEKLYEELAYAAESLSQTRFPGILALASQNANAPTNMPQVIQELTQVAVDGTQSQAITTIRSHVPEMKLSPIATGPGLDEQKHLKLPIPATPVLKSASRSAA